MNLLRSWWRWWQDGEADIARRAGRDERYRRIEGDALRIAARTLPVTTLLLLVAGRLWLPETIERADVLTVAGVGSLVILAVFWLTAKAVRDRRGAILSDPVVPPGRALAQFLATAIGVVALTLLVGWLLETPANWIAVLGALTGLALWPLMNGVRWRHAQRRQAERVAPPPG
jgi:hypothetical protein